MPTKAGVFYGANEWCYIAAIAMKRRMRDRGYTGNSDIAVVIPGRHLDGVTMTGPSATDIGKPGKRNRGIYQEWFRLCGRPYGLTSARVVEPRIAEMIFMRLLQQEGIHIYKSRQVAETGTPVTLDGGGNITAVTMTDGSVFNAPVWYDGSTCMDLLGKAGTEGVHWRIGSEGEAEYGESLAGYGKFGIARTGATVTTQFGGVNRPQVSEDLGLAVGAAYDGVQAFGPRMQYTRRKGFFREWEKARYGAFDGAEGTSILDTYNREDVAFWTNIYSRDGDIDNVGIGGGKFQDNGDYILTDGTGRPRHWDYARLTYAQRDQFHTDWKVAAMRWNYFRAYDAQFSGTMQNSMSTMVYDDLGVLTRVSICGYPKDEHTDNDYMPRIPYIREARRSMGDYVLTQMDLTVTDVLAPRNTTKSNGISVGGYSLDTHPDMYIRTGANSFIISGSRPQDQTGVVVPDAGYTIPFTALYNSTRPNLMFGYPSCTHTAWGSIRIVLNLCLAAEAAGIAMADAVIDGTTIPATNVAALQAVLTGKGLFIAPITGDPEDPTDPEDPDTPTEEDDGA